MGPKVALDTAVFIYAFEQNPRHGQACRKLLADIEKGTLEGVTSVISLTEVLIKPLRLGNRGVERLYIEAFHNLPNLRLVPVSAEVAVLAADLRAEYDLALGDATVGATALHAGCERLVTNDRDLRKVEARGIRVDVLSRR